MPYKIIKNKNGKFRVINSQTRRILSKNTTLVNAKKQIRLLYMLERNPNMKLRKTKRSGKNGKMRTRTRTRTRTMTNHTKKKTTS